MDRANKNEVESGLYREYTGTYRGMKRKWKLPHFRSYYRQSILLFPAADKKESHSCRPFWGRGGGVSVPKNSAHMNSQTLNPK